MIFELQSDFIYILIILNSVILLPIYQKLEQTLVIATLNCLKQPAKYGVGLHLREQTVADTGQSEVPQQIGCGQFLSVSLGLDAL